MVKTVHFYLVNQSIFFPSNYSFTIKTSPHLYVKKHNFEIIYYLKIDLKILIHSLLLNLCCRPISKALMNS